MNRGRIHKTPQIMIPAKVIEEIRTRETAGRYYRSGRTSIYHVLEDLDKLMLRSYHAE